MASQKNFDKLNHKPNKLWEVNFTIVRKNGTEMYSAHNKGKSVIAERLKLKKTVPWTYVINDLNGEEVAGTFYKNESQKTNQKEFSSNKIKSW